MQRTFEAGKGKNMQHKAGERDLDDYLDPEDNLKFGLTYYLKACLHLDRSTVKPEGTSPARPSIHFVQNW